MKMFCRSSLRINTNVSAILLLALLTGGVLSAQETPQQAIPTGTTQNDHPAYTLHTSTNLVILDVVVSSPNGHPVHDLQAKDFVVSEDGRPQQVRNFQQHAMPVTGHDDSMAPPKLAPGLFTNFTTSHGDGPANVLLLDMLNTPLRDQTYARQQIQDYLNHAPDGTQVAIFGLSNRLAILQGFTSDTRLLKAALSRKNATKGSSLLNDPLGGGTGGGPGESSVSDALADMGTTPDILEAVANAQQFEAESETYQFQQRAQITLDALNELARYLANIPGRKNLIWFSGSLPINILPNGNTNNGFASMGNWEAEFRETTDLLVRSQVSLYPIDSRGLTNSSVYSAAGSGRKYARDPTIAGKDEAKFDAQRAGENDTMLQTAHDTGGRAFINTNGLSAAVAEAIEHGSSYYTLTYLPANKNWDGLYRKIEVAVPGKNYTLSYRRGYYADDPSTPASLSSHGVAAMPEDAAAKSLITRTMVRGSPVPTQIIFTVRVRPETGTAESEALAGNELAAANPEARPPFTHYAVDFALNARDISFSQSNGLLHGAFEFVIFVYDANGALVNRVGSTLHADLKPAVYMDFLHHPLSYNQDISVPRKGDYFLRVAVHDLNSDRVGAVEVPVDSVKNLPPLSADTSPPSGR
ncbi:VWFA-related protein [Edaphobacter aggregans]|uniref:VWFA-related protein n=1 Tax=Edaphobacter aggregans TaxID=570835 RepID=A0A3R9QE39_9BACT|nr:VWA domain-containing protein [Edaphobacter aggregans]RSL19415.1 VWFA-related protein [Edaphobacter aggregans]